MSRMTLLVAGAVSLGSAPAARGQAPDTDVFLVSIAPRNGAFTVTGARNLTNRPGYDNQPAWSVDGQQIYFTSVREGEQADIYRVPADGGAATRITTTSPESEYSATLMPGGGALSVIRVERDSTQRLWSVPLDGSPGRVILERIKPVGYHTWVGATTVALFVLGSPNTLQVATTTSGHADTVVTSIGRSLHTTRDGQVSFVHKVSATEWWLTLLDPATRQTKRLVRMPPRVEDYAWTPDGRVLAGEGSVLKLFDPRADAAWQAVADLSSMGMTSITRLAVSPGGRSIAVVAVPTAR
jgi:hypothetical protein